MGEPCALPPLSRQPSLVRLNSRKRSYLKRTLSEEKIIIAPPIKELVKEDVFLMDNKNRRIATNLLANSLTARLKKNLPDGTVDNDAIKKIRRDSLKDFAHLDNLHRQYTSEMNQESSRLDKESFQILKRQKHLQKQSEMQRRTQDRLESSMRSRSGLSSASLPPLADNGTASADQKDAFPEFASVDLNDQSNVKVFKLKGIYQPTNKYKSRIEPLEISTREKHSVKENNIQESLKMADNTSPADLPSKSRMSKKGLRVSWSRQSRYYPDDASEVESVTGLSRADTRTSNVDSHGNPDRENQAYSQVQKRNFNSRLSVRSDTFLLNKRFGKGRQKIETIGLQWKVKPGAPPHPVPETEVPRVPVKHSGVSHNLMPVTTAMQKEGRNAKKVRWQVQKVQNLSSVEMYKAWLQKLEMLKTSAIDDRLNASPSRSNFTIMTQPV